MALKRFTKTFVLLWVSVVLGMGPGCMTRNYYGYQSGGQGPAPQYIAKPGARYQNPNIYQASYVPGAPAAVPAPVLPPGEGVPPQGLAYPQDQYAGMGPGGPVGPQGQPMPPLPMPTEKAKTYMPPYMIEPPDVLLIDSIRAVPRPPYRIEPLDILLVQVTPTLPDQPINGQFIVTPEGTVSLGFAYGTLRMQGYTLEQAAVAIRNFLMNNKAAGIKDPAVSVSLVQFRAMQQVRGTHLVGMDGTITLGSYGSVCITGLTLCQARAAIERHLARWFLNPEISLSVAAYNSKVFYVITDGGGYGQSILRFPITGNETVLDAIAMVGGLQNVSSTKKIWLARPTPAHAGCYQILPVNWQVIVQAGETDTNYQLFPGDRIYIKADCLIELDNTLAKVFAPIERVLGITLLGAAVYQTIATNPNSGNGNRRGFGF